MDLVELAPTHEPALRRWLDDFLRQQIRWWVTAFNLGWSEERISERIESGDLLAREWKRLRDASLAEKSFVRVAEKDQPAGIVYATVREDGYLGLPIGMLCWVYVDPASRGHKIGTTLHEAAISWMRREGVAGTDLYVTAENTPAEQMYQRLGYHTVDFRMLAPV